MNNKTTDEQIIEIMKTSKNISEWNDNRDLAKQIRPANWINSNIDQGLINKVFPFDKTSNSTPSLSKNKATTEV